MVIDWTKKRNHLMHELADTPREWETINKDAKELAEEGRLVIATYSARIKKLRNMYLKAGGRL